MYVHVISDYHGPDVFVDGIFSFSMLLHIFCPYTISQKLPLVRVYNVEIWCD